MKRLMDGDPGLDIKGIRQDVREIKESLTRLLTERDAFLNQVKGAKWLAGLAGLTTLANILGIAGGLFGG